MSKLRKITYYFCLCLLVFLLAISVQVPFGTIFSLPDNVILSYSDIELINEKDIFSKLISLSVKDNVLPTINNDEEDEIIVQFKLFDLIPIRSQKVKLMSEDEVLASGEIVGMQMKTDGFIVIESDNENILKGDILKAINDIPLDDFEQVENILLNIKSNTYVSLTLIRDNQTVIEQIMPHYDAVTDSYKLGLWVKDSMGGIGTLTFVKDDNRFGSLGHPISESDTNTIISVKNGDVYSCNVMGVNKSKGNVPGEIRALYLAKDSQGRVDKNCEFGVYGWLNEDSLLLLKGKSYKVGGRLTVTPGKAKILSNIDGEGIEEYDIEIIKTNYQNYSNEKGMVLRVTDKKLIEKTGGIVQGMSGSPIIQNDKIVGAVTHVFLNDSTKGYGVYIDWMMLE